MAKDTKAKAITHLYVATVVSAIFAVIMYASWNTLDKLAGIELNSKTQTIIAQNLAKSIDEMKVFMTRFDDKTNKRFEKHEKKFKEHDEKINELGTKVAVLEKM